jgi:nucleotide-binding universal stress UspA family protein
MVQKGDPMLKKILVAFDGSEQSYKAFEFALDISKLGTGTTPEIIVLSVAHPPEPADIVEVDAIIDSATEHYEELFKGLREKAKAKNLEIQTEVAVGHPAAQIVKAADDKKCDMVIVGHRGRSKMADWLLGSVSKRVSSYAPCTVTIVK